MNLLPVKRLLHWGPLSVLGIIKLVTWTMVHHLGMYWPPTGSVGGALHAALFLSLACTTLYYFLQSLLEGPGFVPRGWKPEKEGDIEFLQYCDICNGYKAPRSHHCRKCGRCVLKMDHHCPWINCCVGNANHGYFTYFLTAAVLGCFHATVVLVVSTYHAVHVSWYVRAGRGPVVALSLATLVATLLAIGMAAGVVLAVGALLVLQIRGILRNQTTIEEWIVEKAVGRRGAPFVYPYDVGRWRNTRAVLWDTPHSGLHWPLREGCQPYDLTMEQKAQKSEKRERARRFVCVSEYSGYWVPLVTRRAAALAAPCTDEPRLPLSVGDRVAATRQRKHWLYGEKILGDGRRGPRGWFPRDAVREEDDKRD